MKKVFVIITASLLVVGIVVTGFLLMQKIQELENANNEIENRDERISDLSNLLAAEQETTASLNICLLESDDEINLLTGRIDDLDDSLNKVNLQLDSTRSQLTSVQSGLTSAQTVNSTLTAELRRTRDLRHFESLAELTEWLAKDDTDTKYSTDSTDYLKMACILQKRAAQDGYLLPAYIIPLTDTLIWISNIAIIGDMVYTVEPGDDSVSPYFRMGFVQAVNPEPLR